MPDAQPSAAGEGTPSVLETRGRVLLLIAVQLAAAAVLGAAAHRLTVAPPSPDAGFLLAVVVGLTLAGCLRVDYHYRGHRDSIDLFEAVLVLALFTLAPVPAIAVAAAGKAAAEMLLRITPVKALFNVAQWTLATAAGACTLAALSPSGVRSIADLPALTVAMAVVIAVNSAAVAAVLVLLDLWPQHLLRPLPTVQAFALAAVPGVINLAWGLLLVAAHLRTAWAAPLLLFPLLLHWLQHGSMARVGERVYGRAISSAARALSTGQHPDPGQLLPAFLAEARRVTHSGEVQLAVLRAEGLEIHSSSG